MQSQLDRRAALAMFAGAWVAPRALRAAEASEDIWPTLASDIFGGRRIEDGGALLALDSPYRAEDAAIVPLTLHLLRSDVGGDPVRKLTLVVDENPSPLVAAIGIGPQAGITRLATAVRVNAYTNIHVVAETDGGVLYAIKRFVKAAGGCSAPGPGASAGGPPLGTMRFRLFPPAADAGGQPEAQIMVRHPNYSGMQMDQMTHLYIPAHFVQSLKLWQGDALMVSVDAGISMSENPQLRFDYRPNGATRFRAEAIDNSGAVFTSEWPATPAT